MSELNLTEILERLSQNDPEAVQTLLPKVYDELRAIAANHLLNERPGHTLSATELVHEAYLRLFGNNFPHLISRSHFFAAASNCIRRVLVDHARSRSRQKRGEGRLTISFSDIAFEPSSGNSPATLDLLDLEDLLLKFSESFPRAAKQVEMRIFGGMTRDDAALVLGISPRSAADDWSFALAWLRRAFTSMERS